MNVVAVSGLNVPTTRVIDYNQFLNAAQTPPHVPREPTVDLYVTLSTTTFNWNVHLISPAAADKFSTICQARKYTRSTLRDNRYTTVASLVNVPNVSVISLSNVLSLPAQPEAFRRCKCYY